MGCNHSVIFDPEDAEIIYFTGLNGVQCMDLRNNKCQFLLEGYTSGITVNPQNSKALYVARKDETFVHKQLRWVHNYSSRIYISRSLDNGKHWEDIHFNLPDPAADIQLFHNKGALYAIVTHTFAEYIKDETNKTILSGSLQVSVWKLPDNTSKWERVCDELDGNKWKPIIGISFEDNKIYYIEQDLGPIWKMPN